MPSSIVRWDTSELFGIHSNIKKELTKLKTERKYMNDFLLKIRTAWQTSVSGIFTFRLEESLENLDRIIESLEKHAEGLEAIRQRYSKCEGDIESKMNKLSI